MDKLISGALAVGVFVLALAVYVTGPANVQLTTDGENLNVGVAAGPTHTERQSFLSGSSNGGRVATTSTATTYTLTARDLGGTPTYIDWLPNKNITLSLSSTSTKQYVPNVGDVAKIYIRNASSTAASSITLAAVDAGLDIQVTKNATSSLAVLGLDYAEITLVRESTDVVSALVHNTNTGD